jgi:hypothetical protein
MKIEAGNQSAGCNIAAREAGFRAVDAGQVGLDGRIAVEDEASLLDEEDCGWLFSSAY